MENRLQIDKIVPETEPKTETERVLVEALRCDDKA